MTPLSRRFTAYGSAVLLVVASLTAATAATATAAAAPAATSTKELCGPGSVLRFNRSAFPAKPNIDNQWLRLRPGMQYTTTGKVVSPDGTTTRTVVSTVTGLTKVIDGVKTVVVWDRDYSDGELVESELAFFAQTEKGTVWLFGEYPEEYEDGKLVGAPSTFISGIDKARAGIAMLAHPSEGSGPYTQASAPSVDFLDCGQVVRRTSHTLKIDEFNPLEGASAGHQQKYYRAGVGSVKVTATGGDSQEFLNLDSTTTLSSVALAAVNERALAQDRHGYAVSPEVYGTTERARARC